MAARVRLVLDQAAIRGLTTGPAGPVVQFVRSTTRKVRTRAVLTCPVDTGNLRAAHREEVGVQGGKVFGYVSNDVEYAQRVHDGTPPHVIRPRRAGGVLRFVTGGEVVFAASARHPGTQARPWLREALRDVAVQEGFVILH